MVVTGHLSPHLHLDCEVDQSYFAFLHFSMDYDNYSLENDSICEQNNDSYIEEFIEDDSEFELNSDASDSEGGLDSSLEANADVADTQENSTASFTGYRFTQEQKDAIKNLFQEKGWDYEKCHESNAAGVSDSFDPHDVAPGYVIPQSSDPHDLECLHCFCTPCITDDQRRQAWWPQNPAVPHVLNSQDRKKCYKSFWTMIWQRAAFRDVRYRQRKEEALRRDGQRRQYLYHRRDIMPNCVVELVRNWYPNPKDIPYMGHLWE